MITDSPKEKVTFQRKFKRAYQRSLLWIIGQVAPTRHKENPVPSPKNILILVQEKLGDAILTTPLFKNLKVYFPDIQIHIMIFHRQSNIFANDRTIFRVHYYKNDKLGTIRRLKKLKFDILFNTKDHPSFTFILLSRFLNANFKVGIDHQFHRNHYHYLFQVDFLAHAIKKNCSLLSSWDSPHAKLNLKPYVPPRILSNEVDNFAGKMPRHKFVGINLSAGNSEKEWTTKRWMDFIGHFDEKFIVFAIGNRLADKKLLESECDKIVISPETKSINDAAALVQKLKLLITPSTGLLHVASCYDIKVVGLYRHDPSDHMRFAPFGVKYKKVIAEDHMVSKISVKKVINASKDLLNEE